MEHHTNRLSRVPIALLALGASLLAIALASAAAPTTAQDTWYVDQAAPPGGDGRSPAAAFDSIQPALDLAPDGATIHIAPGTYREPLVRVFRGVALVGAGSGQTILSGDLDADGLPDANALTVTQLDTLPPINLDISRLTIRDAVVGIDTAGPSGRVRIRDASLLLCDTAASLSTDAAEITLERVAVLGNDVGVLSSNTAADPNEHRAVAITDGSFAGNRVSFTLSGTMILLSNTDLSRNTGRASLNGSEITIEHLTAHENTGGAVYAFARDRVLVEDSDFARNGGTALEILGTATVRSCNFTGLLGEDSAADDTGLDMTGPSVIEYCLFEHFGGRAAEVIGQTVVVRHSTFAHNNNNHGDGGAALFTQALDLLVQHCRFENNTDTFAAGLNVLASSPEVGGIVTIEDTIFANNSTTLSGGAICVEAYADTPVTIKRCKFIGNTAKNAGAIITFGVRLAIRDSTFINNRATAQRDQIQDVWFIQRRRPCREFMLVGSSFINVTNQPGVAVSSISYGAPVVANNLFLGGPAPIDVARWVAGRWTTWFVNNAIAPVHPGLVPCDPDDAGGVTRPICATNVVTEQIEDLRLVRLPSDGGDGWGDDPATPDIDESANDDLGDLRPAAGSILIDAGDALAAGEFDRDGPDVDRFKPEPVLGRTDAAGNPRFVDDPATPDRFDRGRFAAIDVGPFEYQPTERSVSRHNTSSDDCVADLNRDGSLDGSDFDLWTRAHRAAEPAADTDRDGRIAPADLAAFVSAFADGCD
ncbi:MAG: right-handed parallel beta-helix repeat-containing protein [Planctomycetota bacterium]